MDYATWMIHFVPPHPSHRASNACQFNAAILEHALDGWITQHASLQKQKGQGPYYCKDEVYRIVSCCAKAKRNDRRNFG